MNLAKRRISKHPIPGKKLSAGIGWITIPRHIDRKEYIQNAYRNSRISITTENEYYDNVQISKETLNLIKFPAKSTELGSLIVYITLPKTKQPIIIGSLNKINELNQTEEFEFNISKESTNGNIQFIGNSENGHLLLTVNNTEKSVFTINISDLKQQAEFNIIVNGNINIETKSINIKLIEGFTYNIQNVDQDSFIKLEAKQDSFKITNNKNKIIEISEKGISLGTNEPMVLGNQNKEVLESLLDSIKSIMNELSTLATSQSTAASSVPITAGLAPWMANISN